MEKLKGIVVEDRQRRLVVVNNIQTLDRLEQRCLSVDKRRMVRLELIQQMDLSKCGCRHDLCWVSRCYSMIPSDSSGFGGENVQPFLRVPASLQSLW